MVVPSQSQKYATLKCTLLLTCLTNWYLWASGWLCSTVVTAGDVGLAALEGVAAVVALIPV